MQWSITYRFAKTDSWLIGSTQLGSSTPFNLLIRRDSFRLRLVCTDRSPTCWAAFWFVRRCEKMARWMVHSKRGWFLLTWYSQIARKVGKTYNKRWSILWIKQFFYHFSEFNVLFIVKNLHFILVHLVIQESFQLGVARLGKTSIDFWQNLYCITVPESVIHKKENTRFKIFHDCFYFCKLLKTCRAGGKDLIPQRCSNERFWSKIILHTTQQIKNPEITLSFVLVITFN